MTTKRNTLFVGTLLMALLALVVLPLLYVGQAGALYPPNGAEPDGAGGYMNPDDGMCVVGIKADGTMKVDWDVKNARDCAAYTTGLTGLSAADITLTFTCPTQPAGGAPYTTACNVKANCSKSDGSLTWSDALSKCFDTSACTIADANPSDGFAHVGTNDAYKHAVTFSLCSDVTGGISRVDLDSTDAMCVSKGGTVKYTAGKCIAYGWVYRNRKADGPPPTLPIFGDGISVTDGVQSTDDLGFCYTGIRMTGGSYTVPVLPAVATSCPSWHNSPGVCTGGTKVGAGCTANSTCSGGGTCNLNNAAEWPACGSSTTGCQTPASYDAGLGWSWDTTNTVCVYAFGVNGSLNADVITAAGAKTPAGSASGDLTAITNQGDCLAAGYSWDNWLPFPGPTSIKTSLSGGDYAGMPAGAQIVKFDALTPVEGGGGEFFSGTGFNCLKCHSDQSRAYQERQKPGFVKTRHQKAGDDLSKPFAGYFIAGSSSWGLQGVQCAMCHSTAKPAQDDFIQVVPAGVVGPPAAGAPKSATGHNQTEYGAHLLDICYTCHGSAANPPTTNPASVIPVSGSDFALTSNLPGPATSLLSTPPQTAGLAPIMNQFLNSPHAMYTGTSTKVDVGNKLNYHSGFEGYVCRSAASNFNRTSATSAACTAAGLTPYTVPGFGYTCYYNAAQCAAAPGVWHTTFDPNAYSWAAGPETGSTTKTTIGGVCSGLGIGNIQTTVYRNGVAEKIPNLDSTTNTACTNNGDGSATSGAAGYWVLDGETSPGGTPADTAQGNCMTCHDVHWAIADTNPEAEPFRRECTTCHSNPGTSASGAPQIDLATINHLKTTGTPLENWLTKPEEACVICHMPNSGGAGSSRMHLWRINTDPTYQTMGVGTANTVAEKACNGGANDKRSCAIGADCPGGSCNTVYASAAWVDLDRACGQCHGGSGTAKPGVPPFTLDQLTIVAKGMHDGAGVTYPVTFSYTAAGLVATATAAVNCSGTCPTFTYDWLWGDTNQDLASTQTKAHPYGAGGKYPVTLTVRLSGKKVGSVTRSVSVAPALAALTVNETGGDCTWTANTWTMSLTDASSINATKIVVDWGDDSLTSIGAQGGSFSHVYRMPGTYTVTHRAIDALVRSVAKTCTTQATPAYFKISGTVHKAGGVVDLASATVIVSNPATSFLKTVYTAMDGTYQVTALKPNATPYTVTVKKTGYTFPAVPSQTLGGDKTGVNVTAN